MHDEVRFLTEMDHFYEAVGGATRAEIVALCTGCGYDDGHGILPLYRHGKIVLREDGLRYPAGKGPKPRLPVA